MNRNTQHNAVYIEKAIIHQFLGKLIQCMWESSSPLLEIATSEIDNQGHDIVISAGNTTRHIQFKTSKHNGGRMDADISLELSNKPSGCVLWMSYDPQNLEIQQF